MNETRVTRRDYLGAVGTAVGCGLAGCLGGSPAVRLLSAGSLATVFDDHVGPAFREETGIEIRGEFFGSNAVMRMVTDRTQNPDVVVSADATLLREQLYEQFTDWDVEFAANSLGVGYNESTPIGRRLDASDPWYEQVREAEDSDIAIADPDLDPLGYRAVQAFELAEREHGIEGFREEMVESVYREPEEPQLMAGVEAGSRAAAVVYRNMAVDRGMPFVEFPDAYNFSNPDLADHYATVSYTTDRGYTATGRPILYNATVLNEADNPDASRRLVQFLIDSPDLLETAGMTVGGSLPRPHGAVPAEIEL